MSCQVAEEWCILMVAHRNQTKYRTNSQDNKDNNRDDLDT